MLDRSSRVLIALTAAGCVAGAFAFSPQRARSAGDGLVAMSTRSNVIAASSGDVTAVPVERDPFAVPQPLATPPAEIGNGRGASAQPAAQPDGIVPLPSNLSVDTIPALPGDREPSAASADRVTAVVTGAHPYALLEVDGRHVIDGVGDRVGGSRIVSIDLNGVTLESGARISVHAGVSP